MTSSARGPARTLPPDQAQRDAAIAERGRNVLIDAGAGTGKTTILVDRLVAMIGAADGVRPVPISRIAAITFTRKAAGELRLRIRERLLKELAGARGGSDREARLREALAGLDTAHVGTIHSFADRLLRLRPVEAELSPSYEVVEDEEALLGETFEVLLQAVESGTLAAELAGTPAAARAEEATATVLAALGAGLRAESQEYEWGTHHGLDALIAGFIRQRDVPPPDAPPAAFDAAAFRGAADAFAQAARSVEGGSPGADWIAGTARLLRRLRDAKDPIAISRDLGRQLRRAPSGPTKSGDFDNDEPAWAAWKAFKNGLGDQLRAPLDQWLGTRLVRLFPVAVALYERVKARQRRLDQLDLLVKLRDLLVANREVRAEFQGLFDHIFVDEFQDTDPLQAEIVLLLAEREPRAAGWRDVVLAEDRLTLVGDPKQSIYRFRRADVAMYDEVCQVVGRSGPLRVTLSANFRSRSALIRWLNDRFERILGRSPNGHPFDPATGRVFQQPLEAGREAPDGPVVNVLPFDFRDGAKHKADEYRELEGRALARYLRHLVEASPVQVTDPLDGRSRGVRYGDIAVLAISTWRLSLLFPSLDAEGIPYASRGGKLFLADPLHRQFLLGLRAVADRDDGVAEAALLRPPFFAVDPADLVRALAAAGGAPPDAGAERVRQARELIRELRQRRVERSPGSTARDLLERTALGRAVALGPNGLQRLARLREVCLVLEQMAAAEGLDYDAVTARLREWVDAPAPLDPPYPVGTEAVQVLTVHQAKGLEFPVVVLWDGRGIWDSRGQGSPWSMSRDGRGWLMELDDLDWEEPAGGALRDTEQQYRQSERRRVVYVAATRARDLLVVPRAGAAPPGKLICGDLLAGAGLASVRELEPYRDGAEPAWARAIPPRGAPERLDGAQLDREVTERWSTAAGEAGRPRFAPASVTGEAHAHATDGDGDLPVPAVRKPRAGRFGSLFGDTVHGALAMVLRDPALEVGPAVRRAARHAGLAEHLDEAAADVVRALGALRREGIMGPVGPTLQVEYPVAGTGEGGLLLSGYIDLVDAAIDHVRVIDFKTDAPPPGPVEDTYPEYVAQVRIYGRLLTTMHVPPTRSARIGLLFTADGTLRWART